MNELIFGVVGMVSGILAIVFSAVNTSRSKQSSDKREGREDGMVLTEIGYVKAGIDDLKVSNRDLRTELQKTHDIATKAEESSKQAHKRIDNLEKYHQPN